MIKSHWYVYPKSIVLKGKAKSTIRFYYVVSLYYNACIDGFKNVMATISGGKKRWPHNSVSSLLRVLLMPVSAEALPSVIPATQKKSPIGGHHLSKLGRGWGKSRKEGLCSSKERILTVGTIMPTGSLWAKMKTRMWISLCSICVLFRFPRWRGGTGASHWPGEEK